jgi:hypothetical protein
LGFKPWRALAKLQAEELHPRLTGQVWGLLLVEAANMLLAFVLLEGFLVAVKLIEDASLGVAFECMAGIHQGPRLSFFDEGDRFAHESVEDLATAILQIESDNKSKHVRLLPRSSAAAYPGALNPSSTTCAIPYTECGLAKN